MDVGNSEILLCVRVATLFLAGELIMPLLNKIVKFRLNMII
jgi:hypothetical protein